MMFRLVEKTSGPWMGRVWRCEEMTQQEADKRNAQIAVMQWELCSDSNQDGSGGQCGNVTNRVAIKTGQNND